MAQDYFALLGLAPGQYAPREISRRYQTRRAALLTRAQDPSARSTVLRDLDDLHVAYQTLRAPTRQEAYRQSRSGGGMDAAAELRRLIAASLEDGLLRCSRRDAILERAAALGFNEFQTHLLIAQVQFGDEEVAAAPQGMVRRPHPRLWARVAAVGVAALAVFLGLVHWLGV